MSERWSDKQCTTVELVEHRDTLNGELTQYWFRGTCTCGWRGPRWPERESAERDRDRHVNLNHIEKPAP